MGWGHFSTVWRVRILGDRKDSDLPEYAALKIQKSASHYADAARDEIKILQQIKDADGPGAAPVARLLDWFEHSGPNGKHVCVVMESLGDNLLTLVKLYDYRGIPMESVKMVARCTLEALDFLHSKLQIIHTDLKPENILLTGKVPKVPKRRKGKRKPKGREEAENGKGEGKAMAPAGEPTSQPSDRGGPAVAEGKIAQLLAAGQPLTKNQKKKLKKKLKKREAAAAEEAGEIEERDAPPASEPEEEIDEEAHLCRTLIEAEAKIPKTCKVIDLGNACWTYKKFTSDIQTRQYRCPEVILGASYSTPADIWSLACILFELITGDYLFEPKSGKDYSRDEDHLALFQEALGKIPKRIALKGKFARDFFNRNGDLKHIKKLQHWPLTDVFIDKYEIEPEEADCIASFLYPMLEYDPEKRATAYECLQHPWLQPKQPMAKN